VAVTAAVRVDSPPPQGIYELRLDRFALEVAVRPFPHGRFRPVRGTLEAGVLTVEVSAKSLRTNVPLLHRMLTGSRGLWAARHSTVSFTAPFTPDGAGWFDIAGTLRVRHTAYPLPLRARVVHLDDDTVVLAAHGVLTRARFPRRLRIEAAMELTR
jgi:hypothetical protein